MQPTSVLATVTGRDRPGVTAALLSVLAAHDVDIRDVEQVVIRERLMIAVLFDLRGDPRALRSAVTRAAQALGMEGEVAVADIGDPARRSRPGRRSHVVVMGRPLRAGAVSHVAQCIADVNANIDSVTQLSAEPVTAIEFMVLSTDPTALRATLVQAAEDIGVDIAVEAAELRRRAKRLVLLDAGSTLIRDDTIDQLAERAGVSAEVAAITKQAMVGELDFGQSLRARVAALAGLPLSELEAVRRRQQVTPGAQTLVRTLRRLGFHVGVVSGGFSVVIDQFVEELGLDFAAANQLEIVDGVLTGAIVGPILDRAGRGDALREFAGQCGVPMSQTVAIGDGPNDTDMIEAAGLGVAFNAKSALRAAADASLPAGFLDPLLFVLGLTGLEIDDADG